MQIAIEWTRGGGEEYAKQQLHELYDVMAALNEILGPGDSSLNISGIALTVQSQTPSVRPWWLTKDLVKATYWFAASMFWLYVFTESASVLIPGPWNKKVLHGIKNPFGEAFVWSFAAAMYADLRYFGGQVMVDIRKRWLWPLPIRRGPWWH